MFKNKKYSPLIIVAVWVIITAGCANSHIDENILPGAYDTEQYLPLLLNKKVGIVANYTSVINSTNVVDTLTLLGINIRAIYTPEHGFRGTSDAGAAISDTVYSASNIPVYSLYGNKKKPDKKQLEGIDIMIFDLQDVGVRFYTYLSTLHYIMEACAKRQIPILVLDRPNPNGYYIDGPLLDLKFRSFVGLHPVPIVYGMTIGEYALMINGEGWLPDSLCCELKIIKCRNYTHSSFYELPVPPSPNLPEMKAIYLYPSVALFEGTVVSEGRGTEYPFELIGHPDYPVHDFSFIPHVLKGYSLNPKFRDRTCYGTDLRNLPVDSIRNFKRINLSYLKEFYSKLKLNGDFFSGYFDLLAGNDALREQIEERVSIQDIYKSWEEGLVAFKKIRVKYLLYPDFE